MYIEQTRSYYDHGEQRAARALFLLLIQPPGGKGCDSPIKAIVRNVALHQTGNFMMGRARAYGHSITVSGSYGGDGLPCSVPQAVYDRASVVLPDYLYQAWNKGEGWNSAGSEAPAMRAWARANLAELRK
jgi:hypothetical protein